MPKIGDRALEIGLYLPLGAYARAREGLSDLTPDKLRDLFEDLVDRGEERTKDLTRVVRRRATKAEETTAKTIAGVQKQAKKTATKAEEATQDMTRILRRRATKAEEATEKAAARVQTQVKKTVNKASAATAPATPKLPRVAAPKSAGELPIASYNSLTASEILTELRGLTQTELAKVYKFEKAKEDRATILDAIDSKLQVLPIAAYDALTVEEISGRLESLSATELKTLRRYETDTKNRTTILEKIDSLI